MMLTEKRWKGIFAEKPFISKLMVLFGTCFISLSVFTFLGFVIASLLFHVNLIANPDLLNHYDQPHIINALKLIQTLSAIGMFIIPSALCAWLFSVSPAEYLYIKRKPLLSAVVWVTIILFASVPLINWLLFLNQQMALPSFLAGMEQWMKNAEDQATMLTEAFLKTSSPIGLLGNLLMIGLIPAIGEELLFRGILQRLLSDTIKNRHLPIIISAALFSALHMQYYGFVPRMLLGVLFGYFLLWSGTLWLPIIGHFINNATAVLFAFYAAKSNLPFNQDTIGAKPGDLAYLLTSAMITVICLGAFYRLSKRWEVILPEK